MVIAIDGPSGAGKSEISRALSARLGVAYLDTGALYRAVGLKALESGVALDDEAAIEHMLGGTSLSAECRPGSLTRVLLDGRDVTGQLRGQDAADAASRLSTLGAVRAWLLDRQRALASERDAILDGRDIGTQVFPDAEVKVYLTASAEVRALRRLEQLRASGRKAKYADVLREVNERDERDMNRALSPLRRADDAVLIDSSGMTIEEVLNAILALVERARS